MQIVIRRIIGDELEHEVIDSAYSICQLDDTQVSITFKDDRNICNVKYVCL